MRSSEEAVDKSDNGFIGEFHEGFEDPVEKLEGIALVQGGFLPCGRILSGLRREVFPEIEPV
jgi:hypothetical protein